jgi:hypothetical protein
MCHLFWASINILPSKIWVYTGFFCTLLTSMTISYHCVQQEHRKRVNKYIQGVLNLIHCVMDPHDIFIIVILGKDVMWKSLLCQPMYNNPNHINNIWVITLFYLFMFLYKSIIHMDMCIYVNVNCPNYLQIFLYV